MTSYLFSSMISRISKFEFLPWRYLFSFRNRIHVSQERFTRSSNEISKLSSQSYSRVHQLTRLLTGPNEVSGKLIKRSSELPLYINYKVLSTSRHINKRSNLIFFRTVISKLQKYLKMDIYKSTILSPPAAVRGMTVLDRSIFVKKVCIPAVKVPVRNISKLKKAMDKCLLKSFIRVKPVVDLADDDPQRGDYKLFLLDAEKYPTFDSLDGSIIERLKAHGIDLSSVHYYDLDVSYENWSVSDVMRAVLPEKYSNVSSFCVIGHIAHLNLKDEVLQYKNLIGEVILDKVNIVKTVVNKINIIDNTYRNFAMELLAGEDNFVTVAKENGCSFHMDFSKVYWNPRLVTEHASVISSLTKGSVLYDVFAGIGPFSIPSAKKGVYVLANDLNPESYIWLNENIKVNKTRKSALTRTFNMDGREFIKTVLAKDLMERWTGEISENNSSIAVVMNLPGLAIEFLDAFKHIVDTSQLPGHVNHDSLALPKVYCYCFTKSDDPDGSIKTRAEASLGAELPDDHTIRHVRNVAPNKDMYCLSFTIPERVLCVGAEQMTDDSPECKRLKLDETLTAYADGAVNNAEPECRLNDTDPLTAVNNTDLECTVDNTEPESAVTDTGNGSRVSGSP